MTSPISFTVSVLTIFSKWLFQIPFQSIKEQYQHKSKQSNLLLNRLFTIIGEQQPEKRQEDK